MWTATIVNKEIRNGALILNVVFSSGEEGRNNVTQEIDMTGGSVETLNRKIQSQLDTLNATDALNAQIETGDFTPVVPEEDPKIHALSELREKKNLVDLGVLAKEDPEYTKAVAAVKAELDKGELDNDTKLPQ